MGVSAQGVEKEFHHSSKTVFDEKVSHATRVVMVPPGGVDPQLGDRVKGAAR